MNGVHDLGGDHGFGPVLPERDEPVFHAEWERVIAGLQIACAASGFYSGDEIRYQIEQMDPVHYLAARYYERWVVGVESTLLQKGIIDRASLDEKLRARASRSEDPSRRPEVPASEATDKLLQVISEGSWTDEQTDAAPAFRRGARVQTKTISPEGHTRLPQYARGKAGVVEAVYPSLVFPDTNAVGSGTHPQYVYNVAFTAEELWGPDGEPGTTLRLDLWESYLEAVAPPRSHVERV